MLKWALTTTLLLTAGAVTGSANVVLFASLGTDSFDISASSTGGLGYTFQNVTFLYDNFNDATTNGTAQINANGIDGFAGSAGLAGSLNFIFGAPMSGGLIFNFTVRPATGTFQVSDGAQTTLNNALSDSALAPTNAAGAGRVSILDPTGPYNIAGTYFTGDPSALNFNVSDLTYNIVPEPASFLLIGIGLLGLGCARRFSRRRP